jgi:Arginase family
LPARQRARASHLEQAISARRCRSGPACQVLLRGLAGVRLVGMDLVEISPALDHADLTCHLGAWLIYEGLALRPG